MPNQRIIKAIETLEGGGFRVKPLQRSILE